MRNKGKFVKGAIVASALVCGLFMLTGCNDDGDSNPPSGTIESEQPGRQVRPGGPQEPGRIEDIPPELRHPDGTVG